MQNEYRDLLQTVRNELQLIRYYRRRAMYDAAIKANKPTPRFGILPVDFPYERSKRV